MIGVMLAGVASGVGKTTITVGLIAALRRRGLAVQPFKVGPDYIDTSYHTRAADGVASRNLDRWLLPAPVVRQLYARAARDVDVAVVEGVMGVFDGRLDGQGFASSAHLARELSLPVVLVVDAARLSWSAGAIVLGYREFDPTLNLIGVVLNRVGGPQHAAELIAAVEGRAGVPVLGWLPEEAELTIPERYLGLVPTTEGSPADAYFAAAEATVASGIDIDRLLALAQPTGLPPATTTDAAPDLFPAKPPRARAAIAVAQDRAFSFYYQDSLDLLAAWGAELVPFSPLEDTALPPDASGVYLGGGFPELFADELSANAPMLAALRDAHARDLPVYAECGGLMLLGRSLVDAEGRRHTMAGVVPLDSTLTRQRLTIGYREARAARDTLLLNAGEMIRAHEFHWSGLEAEPSDDVAAYQVDERQPPAEGFARGNTLASYLHLHFASDGHGRLARAFIERAAAARSAQVGP
jgi:cobyrinic acid a,c-diamide synthase